MATRTQPKGGSKPTMLDSRNDIPKNKREPVVRLLNARLADTFDLVSQTKQAHWNVKGKDFFQLHELFDELHGMLLPHVDEIAERATALGGVAMGTTRMAAKASTIPEFPAAPGDGKEYVDALAERYSKLAEAMRDAIDECDEHGDKGSADLFTQIVRDLDKSLYLLEAHLQQG